MVAKKGGRARRRSRYAYTVGGNPEARGGGGGSVEGGDERVG